jgi:integral membrane protein
VSEQALPPEIRTALFRYRVMANIVGVLLVVLCLVGVPLANFDGTSMWGVFDSTPAIWTEGTRGHAVGEWITTVLGIAHGYLYMIFLLAAFMLSRRASWSMGFTLVVLVCGTVPILSFWAEHRATRQVRRDFGGVSTGSTTGKGSTTGNGSTTGKASTTGSGSATGSGSTTGNGSTTASGTSSTVNG